MEGFVGGDHMADVQVDQSRYRDGVNRAICLLGTSNRLLAPRRQNYCGIFHPTRKQEENAVKYTDMKAESSARIVTYDRKTMRMNCPLHSPFVNIRALEHMYIPTYVGM
ncbi:unnamed protein product [Periconia digitata]|uniref:Uncharacterized protein n=1 Tax=Periconia digitata TaxID=1303443 RepID=A0A9W4U9R8_9PLEO|nr:unnamed protein product [Periconia digitata]